MKKEQKINNKVSEKKLKNDKNLKNKKFTKIQKEKNSKLFIWVLVSVLSLVIFISIILALKYLNIFLQGKQSTLESVENVYSDYYNSKWFEPIINLRNIILGPIGIKSMFSFKNATSLGGWSNPVIVDGIINWVFFALLFLVILFMVYKILKKIFFTFTNLPELPKKTEVEKKFEPEIVSLNKKQKFVVLKRIEKDVLPVHENNFYQKNEQVFTNEKNSNFATCEFCGNTKNIEGLNLNKHNKFSKDFLEEEKTINININLVKKSN